MTFNLESSDSATIMTILSNPQDSRPPMPAHRQILPILSRAINGPPPYEIDTADEETGAADTVMYQQPVIYVREKRKTALINVRVFDGYRLLDPGTVVIDGDRIGFDSTGAYVVDGHGGVLLPGLIDAHAHISAVEQLTEMRNYGVTTVMDMECFPPSLLAQLREKAGQNGLTDLLSAGVAATYHRAGFPPLGNVETAADAPQWVADRVSEGSDYIKVIAENLPSDPKIDPAVINAVVASAHQLGKLTVAHATSMPGWKVAHDAQVNMITHVPLSGRIEGEMVSNIASGQRCVIPTLTMMEALAKKMGALSADYNNARHSVRNLHEAHIPILAGTDANTTPNAPAAPAHGETLHHELELLVNAGLSTVDALRAATILPAQKFGLWDRGLICPGKRADLLLVSGDPIKDIRATRSIQQVWVAGVNWVP
ncbi:MAG: hypothetical protein M1819_005341 [Sarea resinae]|nr:MAG: hypothetical protein M1819_005341 [Sarea resinae]